MGNTEVSSVEGLNSAQRETLEEFRGILDRSAGRYRLDQNASEDPAVYELRLGGFGYGFVRFEADGSMRFRW